MGSIMDPLKLEMFVTTKDCDSLYKAAMLLKKAPVELKNAISSLEEDIGSRLFAAKGSSMQLTCEGQLLYLQALDILDSWYVSQGIINRIQETSRC